MNREDTLKLANKFATGIIGLHVEGDTPTIMIAISTLERDVIVAALRASAAPEEGMNHRIAYDSATHDRMVAARGSRKAEPVAWMCPDDPERETAFHWKRPKDGLCNSPGCKKKLVPVYAALAPATEPGTSDPSGKTE